VASLAAATSSATAHAAGSPWTALPAAARAARSAAVPARCRATTAAPTSTTAAPTVASRPARATVQTVAEPHSPTSSCLTGARHR
jgi:hypothetical protein